MQQDPAGKTVDTEPQLRLAGSYDYLATAVFLIFWLIPIFIMAFTGESVSPQLHLRWLHNVACLFTPRHPVVFTFTLEGLPKEAGLDPAPTDWIDLGSDENYAPMQPFGFRTRLGWRMDYIDSFSDPNRNPPWVIEEAAAQRRDLAEWARRRYAELNPDREGLRAVRVVWTSFDVETELKNPAGRWVRPDFISLPPGKKFQNGIVYFED